MVEYLSRASFFLIVRTIKTIKTIRCRASTVASAVVVLAAISLFAAISVGAYLQFLADFQPARHCIFIAKLLKIEQKKYQFFL